MKNILNKAAFFLLIGVLHCSAYNITPSKVLHAVASTAHGKSMLAIMDKNDKTMAAKNIKNRLCVFAAGFLPEMISCHMYMHDDDSKLLSLDRTKAYRLLVGYPTNFIFLCYAPNLWHKTLYAISILDSITMNEEHDGGLTRLCSWAYQQCKSSQNKKNTPQTITTKKA